jgi:hypothetical protein
MDLTNEDVADVLALLDSLPYDELDLQTSRWPGTSWPPGRTALDATVPYSKPMEEYILPDEEKIAEAVRAVLR